MPPLFVRAHISRSRAALHNTDSWLDMQAQLELVERAAGRTCAVACAQHRWTAAERHFTSWAWRALPHGQNLLRLCRASVLVKLRPLGRGVSQKAGVPLSPLCRSICESR